MTQNPKIYRIDLENYRFENFTVHEEYIEKIIRDTLVKYKRPPIINLSNIPKYDKGTITYYLFIQNFDEKDLEWRNFLPPQLAESSNLKTQNLTLLLFISNGIDIFIVVGGKGYEAIVKYIDHSFGLKVLSKVINPNEDVILSISSKGCSSHLM
jgi:hypothetical protein